MQKSTVFFDVVMSLDGFIAPEGMKEALERWEQEDS